LLPELGHGSCWLEELRVLPPLPEGFGGITVVSFVSAADGVVERTTGVSTGAEAPCSHRCT
jgi:hypothetical protein